MPPNPILSYKDIHHTRLREAAKYLTRALESIQKNHFVIIFKGVAQYQEYVQGALTYIKSIDDAHATLHQGIKRIAPEELDVNKSFAPLLEQQKHLERINEGIWPTLSPGARRAAQLADREIDFFFQDLAKEMGLLSIEKGKIIEEERETVLNILNNTHEGIFHLALKISQMTLAFSQVSSRIQHSRPSCLPMFTVRDNVAQQVKEVDAELIQRMSALTETLGALLRKDSPLNTHTQDDFF